MSIKLANPSDQRNGPNCGVTAVAIASGASFTRTWNLFRTLGERSYNAKQWRGRTHHSDQRRVLNKLGIEWSQEWDFKPGTLSHVVNQLDQDEVYLIVTTGHVQVVCNGTVIDQRGPVPIADYWGKRKVVRHVLRIDTPFAAAPSKEVPVSDLLPPMAQPAATSLFPALFPTQAPAAAELQLSLF